MEIENKDLIENDEKNDKKEDEKANIARNKIEAFLKDKYNLIFLGIILFAFVLRFYYFLHTYSQPLWWDESEYMSIAKNIAFGLYYDYPVQRPPLFPILIAALYLIGATEAIIRFVVVLLPSLGCVIMTYLLGKTVYDKKIGLIASFMMSVFWVLMFDTLRMHTDALGLFFGLLSVYFFWEGYIKKKDTKLLFLAALFLALAFLVRLFYIIIIPIILIFLLITERLNFLKQKQVWYTVLLSSLLLVPYLIWNFIKFKNPLAFLYGYITPKALSAHTVRQIPWTLIVDIFKIYIHWIYIALFILGLITLIDLILGFDLILKNKNDALNASLKGDLFMVINILAVIFFFTFVFRAMGEPRWLVFIAPAMFFIIAKGLMKVYSFLSKYNKILALIAILALLFIGAYQEIKYGDLIINEKKTSYEPVKEAGLWIKDNSLSKDIIFTKSVPQITYYSEKEVYGIPGGTDFENDVVRLKPKYLILSVFEVHSEELLRYPEKYSNILKPVQAYFADAEKKQPLLIIYEFTSYDFGNSSSL